MLSVADLGVAPLARLFMPYGLAVMSCPRGADIPGSFWGEPEAGLIENTLYVRDDTPVHSALHEGAHFICMDAERRAQLDTDAGGDDLEECAVCYLQVELSACLDGYSRSALLRDMDTWGYSFRLGSATRWYAHDADDAREWLEVRGLLPLHTWF